MISSNLKVDELGVEGKKDYTKNFLEENGWGKIVFFIIYSCFEEKLLLSCELTKINDAKKKQKRKFVLTTKAIYNFDTKSIE